ncbi:hypothetical protein NMY22_g6339 [Coprinellus aureogranulatus]|nr:hypothetical protein NMY22_g6339 [Coprinellus aureogranulatus]
MGAANSLSVATPSEPPFPPPEVWLRIFHLATEDPSSSLERLELGPKDSNYYVREGAGYRKSLALKLSILRTCRAWNHLATPLLFEHVTVTTDMQYWRLLKALTPNEGQAVTSPGASLRRYSSEDKRNFVHRLDLVLCDEESALKTAVRLTQMFPKLKTLVACLSPSRKGDPYPLLSILPPTLKHLYWTHHPRGYSSTKGLSLSQVVKFFDDHPNLTAVAIPYEFEANEQTQGRYRANEQTQGRDRALQPRVHTYRKKCWPSIRAIVLQNDQQAEVMVTHLPSGAFPNLETVNASYDSSETSSRLQDFIAVHVVNQRLKVLSFDMRCLSQNIRSSILFRLAEYTFPVEVHLRPTGRQDIIYESWFSNIPARPAQVTVLGLHGMPHIRDSNAKEQRECWDMALMQYLPSFPWTKIFPNLKTIRLMAGEIDIDLFRAHDSIGISHLGSPGRYAKYPIRVEDISGRLLAEFTSGISSLVGGRCEPHCQGPGTMDNSDVLPEYKPRRTENERGRVTSGRVGGLHGRR